MRGFLTDIAGTIASAVITAIGVALWDIAFAPLWGVSPKRFVLTCVMAALIGAGIACSIVVTAFKKRQRSDADRIADLEGEISYLNDRIYELEHPFMGVNERLRRSGVGGFGDVWK